MSDTTQTPRSQWNRYYAAMYDHSAAKPGADLSHPWGHSVFRVSGKTFVFLGGPDSAGFTVKPYPGSRDALLSTKKASVSDYIGRFGWVSLKVANQKDLALALQLIDESYEHNIPKRARVAAAAKAQAKPRARSKGAKRGTSKKRAAKSAAKAKAR
jgi:predicted DNA-binding protein (MmcQ/YjbR family)